MSEYQYVAFRAVDRPLTDRELAYAEKQSTRAEISRWSFENEYHYGDFHGDVEGLLRHGYDVHLHYANYGTRSIALRLPGPPLTKNVWSKYLGTRRTPVVKGPQGGRWHPVAESVSRQRGARPTWRPQRVHRTCYQDSQSFGCWRSTHPLYVLWLCAARSRP